MSVPQCALIRALQKKDSRLVSKLLELREGVEDWLTYIPHTFPHYTRHTVKHSEEIILQVSNIVYRDDDPEKPALNLSAIETYIVCAAAYLHDAGMVASDKEKSRILASEDWKEWVTSGGAAPRWSEIQAFRAAAGANDVKQFICDVQVRFLLAEFIRARHHLRAGDVVEEHDLALGRVSFSDPALRRAIADVCVAHGLSWQSLRDDGRFPDERDIHGEKVNLRLVAMLLRLGDLLDMSFDRACPLLLSAACPLPANSIAHWTQYNCIQHRLTSPDRIEIAAQCDTQQEHQVLLDWCQWIVNEVQAAAIEMGHAKRHKGWIPPQATLDGENPTIKIRPSKLATYIPRAWRFELDPDIVVERLVHDVYSDNREFIRELIQNAADASRVAIYEDARRVAAQVSAYPYEIAYDVRSRYPIRISVEKKEVENQLSGEKEFRQAIVVEDVGIGMDERIIRNYLLQIGRSYYQSSEFKRRYSFAPVSRFGLGFLSVFGLSDNIVIDTYKPSSEENSRPIRLLLTGPKNYLLVEHGTRTVQGTLIQVLLEQEIPEDSIVEAIQNWCRMLEFPVHVKLSSRSFVVEEERPKQWERRVRDVTENGAHFEIRSLPIALGSVRGSFYLVCHLGPKGERWDLSSWARYQHEKQHPDAEPIELPERLVCQHGIAMTNERFHSDGFTARIDLRGKEKYSGMSRVRKPISRWRLDDGGATKEVLIPAILKHLAESEYAIQGGWVYRQRLAEVFQFRELWKGDKQFVPVRVKGVALAMTYDDVSALESLVVYQTVRNSKSNETDISEITKDEPSPVMVNRDLERCADWLCKVLFGNRHPVAVTVASKASLRIEWRISKKDEGLKVREYSTHRFYFVEKFDPKWLSLAAHKTAESYEEKILLNEAHPFVAWLKRRMEEPAHEGSLFAPRQLKQVLELLEDPARYAGHRLDVLEKFLNPWRNDPRIPRDQRPPSLSIGDFG